jgi:hypothetical protein
MVAIELRRWRLTVKLRDFGDAPFSAEGLLWDNIILELSSIGPINTIIIFLEFSEVSGAGKRLTAMNYL